MKKYILLIVFAFVFGTSAFASNMDLAVSVDSENKSVTISGSISDNTKKATVFILRDDIPDYFNQIDIAENGSFAHSYNLYNPIDDVEYTVRITSDTEQSYKTFRYYSKAYREEILRELISKQNVGDFSAFVKAKQFVLDIDLLENSKFANLSTRAENDLFLELFNEKNQVSDAASFRDLFNSVTSEQEMVDKINASDDVAKTIAEYNDTYFHFLLNDDWDLFKDSISESMKDKEFHTKSEISECFQDLFYTGIFNSIDYTDRDFMLQKLLEYKEELSIPDNFFSDKKTAYVKLMMGITFESMSNITSKAANAQKVTDNTSSTPSSNGGGGGNGGGSKVTASANIPLIDTSKGEEPILTKEQAASPFLDLENVVWAKEAIEDLADKKILSGRGEKKFSPNDNVTRGEFAKMVVLSFESYDESLKCDEFFDVAEADWFYPYVANGKNRGVIMGMEDGSFLAYDNITRENMCVMVYRQLLNLGKTIEFEKDSFSDDSDISEYCKDAVYALKSLGIISGVGDNSFAPKQSCTRAMAAQIIYKARQIQ